MSRDSGGGADTGPGGPICLQHVLQGGVLDRLHPVQQRHAVFLRREDEVDRVCAGLEILAVHQMGRHKTVAVRGSGVKLEDARKADVDIAPMNLQNVFVALCSHGDAQ